MECYGYKEAFDVVVLSSLALSLLLMFVMTSERLFGDFTLRALLSIWALLVLYATIALFTFLVVSSTATAAEVLELFDGRVLAMLWQFITFGILASLLGCILMFASCITGYALRYFRPQPSIAA